MGAANRLKACLKKGKRAIVIDDLLSTGGSVLKAVKAAENEGADVIGVCAIFSYQLPSVNGNFEKAGVPFATLTNYTELLEAAVEESYITKEEQELLHRWREDPETGWTD